MGYMEERLMRKNGMLPPLPTKKDRKPLKKKSDKKIEEERLAKESGSDNSLDRWFEERRREMTGRCCLCGGKTEKHNDKTYRNSIHHLLDKRKSMFPSLALHPNNFLEVCFYGNSCHTNIHNGLITFELLHDSKEWLFVEKKLKILLPLCTEKEKQNKLYSKLIELVYNTK